MNMAEFEDAMNRKDSRKRVADPQEWDKVIRKTARHSGLGDNPKIGCKHKNNHWCNAEKLTTQDVISIHRQFKDGNKQRQDSFITKSTTTSNSKRNRGTKDRRNRQYSIQYSLKTELGETLRLCANTFCSVLCINYKRAQRLASFFHKNRSIRKESRGGARQRGYVQALKTMIRQHNYSEVSLHRIELWARKNTA